MSGQPSSSSSLISTRRRACTACQQAKRRCDQRLPRCGRCTQKGLDDCNYPSLEAAVAAADFNFFTDVLGGSAPADTIPNILPATGRCMETETPWPLFYNTSGLGSTVVTRDAMLYCTEQYRSFPRRWVSQSGTAPFIHPALYLPSTGGADGLPQVLQDCFCACAAYAAKNDENASLVMGIIEAKATALLYLPDQQSWTLPQQVAALQALVMYQMIRWFDGDIRQRVQADSVEPILAAWTTALQARVGGAILSPDDDLIAMTEHSSFTSEAGPSADMVHSRSGTPLRLARDDTKTAWRCWLLRESIRRVIVMSYLIRGVYAMAKQGYCKLDPVVSDMSFTGQAKLWGANTAERWSRAREQENPWWVSRMDFQGVLTLADPRELDEFTVMLAVTYRGRDVVEDWMAHGVAAAGHAHGQM